jgi:hypothetical protein
MQLSKATKLVAVPLALFFAAACADTEPTAPTAQDALFNQGQSQQTVGTSAGSVGKVTLDTEVSQWDVGSGQFNGEFITAEGQGVVIGLRAQERFEGLLGVTGAQGNRVAVYEALTGISSGDNNGTWNYDFHVDLSGARGNARNRTLEDYRLVLEQDFTAQSLFGLLGSDPVLLPMAAEPAGVCSVDTFDADSLCQQSWNPGFGNTDYDPTVARTYNLRLVLTPETFSGPPLAVVIRVNVID